MNIVYIVLAVSLLLGYIGLNRKKKIYAEPESEVFDKFGRRWWYFDKVMDGWMFINPDGHVEVFE